MPNGVFSYWFCLVCAVASCLASCKEDEADAGPGIWVVVDAEAALRTRLERVELRTKLRSATAWLASAPSGTKVRQFPLLLDLAVEGRTSETLRVSGYDGDRKLVERVAELSFVPGERRLLRVTLSEACAALVGSCHEDEGLTCVDCRGTCESARVGANALESASSTSDPLATNEAASCSVRDAGMPDVMDSGSEEVDASRDTGVDAGTDGSTPPVRDAGTDADMDAAGASDSGAAPDSGPSPLLAECSLLLRMNEAAWAGTAGEVRDDSGRANHGVASGTANTTALGRFGRAAQLDGSGWVQVDDSPSLRGAEKLTVAAWFYLDELPGTRYPGIVTKRTAFNVDTAFAVFLWPSNKIYVDIAGEESRFESVAAVEAERWYHVAVVFDGSRPMEERVALYLDGVLDRTAPEASASIPAYTSDITIGNLINGGETFIGRIDDVAIWTRALSAVEIAEVYGAPDGL